MSEPTKGQREAAEYTKRMYEASPYKDPARDKDMRAKLNSMTQVPQDIDGASAGRKFKKNEPGLPEQPGSGIIVEKAKGGKVSSASSRADGIASKGKTRGTMVTMCGGGMAKKK